MCVCFDNRSQYRKDPDHRYVWVVPHVDGAEAAQGSLSAQWDGNIKMEVKFCGVTEDGCIHWQFVRSASTSRGVVTQLCSGSDEVGSFKFLGLAYVTLRGSLHDIGSSYTKSGGLLGVDKTIIRLI